MQKAVRRRVERFEPRYVRQLDCEVRHAVLECGHAINVGPTYAPQRMACWDCGRLTAPVSG